MAKIKFEDYSLNLRSGTVFQIKVPKSATVRYVSIQVVEKSILASADAKQSVDLVPTVTFQLDPDEERVARRFFVMSTESVLSMKDGDVVDYRGTFMHPTGSLLHLLEDVSGTLTLAAKEPARQP